MQLSIKIEMDATPIAASRDRPVRTHHPRLSHNWRPYFSIDVMAARTADPIDVCTTLPQNHTRVRREERCREKDSRI
jgi:hypothetical protein